MESIFIFLPLMLVVIRYLAPVLVQSWPFEPQHQYSYKNRKEYKPLTSMKGEMIKIFR
ncbi:MAG: hypothetical protein CM15mP58_20470 [Burkholderiaceae bacterium]|nr:MAG: hypothetical protein CM15mP58_20470 [Burkholderiaceae bacterium]